MSFQETPPTQARLVNPDICADQNISEMMPVSQGTDALNNPDAARENNPLETPTQNCPNDNDLLPDCDPEPEPSELTSESESDDEEEPSREFLDEYLWSRDEDSESGRISPEEPQSSEQTENAEPQEGKAINMKNLVITEGHGPNPRVVSRVGEGAYWVTAGCHGKQFPMLIDTGSEVTILSKAVFDGIKAKPILQVWHRPLFTANGKPIVVHGHGMLPIQFGNTVLTCQCLIADIKAAAILGIDTLEAYECALDMKTATVKQLLFTPTNFRGQTSKFLSREINIRGKGNEFSNAYRCTWSHLKDLVEMNILVCLRFLYDHPFSKYRI